MTLGSKQVLNGSRSNMADTIEKLVKLLEETRKENANLLTVLDQNEKLREALRIYGVHFTNCQAWMAESDDIECGCGLDKALGIKVT